MYDYKIKRVSNGRTNSSLSCFVATVLSIIGIFIFVTILSHNTLDDIDHLGNAPVVKNKMERWDIIREGEKDMQLLVNSTSSEMKLIRNYVSKTMSIGRLADVEEFVSKEMKQWEEYVEQAVMDRIRIKVDNNNSNNKKSQISERAASGSTDTTAAATRLPRIKYHELSCPDEESEALPLLQFWHPITKADSTYRTPFASAVEDEERSPVKYVTFEPGELPVSRNDRLAVTLKRIPSNHFMSCPRRYRGLEQYPNAARAGTGVRLLHRPHTGPATRPTHVSAEQRERAP